MMGKMRRKRGNRCMSKMRSEGGNRYNGGLCSMFYTILRYKNVSSSTTIQLYHVL